MHALEKEFILTDPNIMFYRRYRDDIFMCYNGSTMDLNDLMARMNDAHPTLKFTFETSDTLVTFLDLQIYKGNRFISTGCLDHKVNQKHTDTHQWLAPDSAHSPSVFSAMIRGETIRYARGCTSETDFINKVEFFTNKLVERNYTRDQVNGITKQINHKNRDDYVNTSNKLMGAKTDIPLVLVTTYTPHIRTPDFKSIILKHWHHIQANTELIQLFPNPPLLAYKRAKNIADYIVKSRLPPMVSSVKHRRGPTNTRLSHKPQCKQWASTSNVYLDKTDLELIDCLVDLMNE